MIHTNLKETALLHKKSVNAAILLHIKIFYKFYKYLLEQTCAWALIVAKIVSTQAFPQVFP